MTPAQDPFYVVKEEIQESINKLQVTFQQWEQTPSNTGESVHLTKQLVVSCESIEWQVDELDMAIAVAVRDPAWYGLDEVELEKHRRWTSTARYQVGNIRKTVETGKEKQNSFSLGTNGVRKELMGLPNDHASQAGRSNNYINQDNDDFISSESVQQLLLIKKQDEELDELSASVRRIGDVGLTIHDELVGQGKLLDEFGMEMETTSNRLDFVQKKVAKVMKKAGAKGQIMMIAFLIILFIILLFLVFFT
ncbi:syntaxin-61-like isoform X1 [Musa acuminata AAA Group]|uniref:syntaxin-61-like isoform X1 n=1 Tax=Musa acuminata AAA Group TaxID=214697 RepID=UPI0031E48F00